MRGRSATLHSAVQKVLQTTIRRHGAIVFNGDSYSTAWHQEAKRRGLPHYRTTVDALPALVSPESVATFGAYQVLSRRELESRRDIYLERYVNDVAVESRLALRMARTLILPAAMDYQARLAGAAQTLRALKKPHCTTVLDELSRPMAQLQAAIGELATAIDQKTRGDILADARYARDQILPAMERVRAIADTLETLVADEHWPLPTYQEMLFIK